MQVLLTPPSRFVVAEGKGVVHCRIMCDDYTYLAHVAKELLRLAPRDNR